MAATEENVDALVPAEGPTRVRLRFDPDGVETKVPPGVSVFDAASWNSTCWGKSDSPSRRGSR